MTSLLGSQSWSPLVFIKWEICEINIQDHVTFLKNQKNKAMKILSESNNIFIANGLNNHHNLPSTFNVQGIQNWSDYAFNF